MATATSTFDNLFIHLASNLATYIEVGHLPVNEIKEADGAVIKFANGRLRAITGTGTKKTYEVTLPYLTRSTLTTLDSFLKVPILIKDGRGRILYGQFFEYQLAEELLPGTQPTTPIQNVTFTVHELTMSVEV